MLQIIGAFIDGFIFIAAGIFLLYYQKKINKSFIKWVGILLIVIGLIFTIINIVELI